MKFNVKNVTEKIIEDIRKYYQDNNAKGAIIGISGGKDSAVALALLEKALGKANIEAFWLPCYSLKGDYEDAKMICDLLDIPLHIHDLGNTYDLIISDVTKNNQINNESELINSNINLKPRLRMSVLYYYAAFYSSVKNAKYLVCGTSNKSEVFVGYFTKGGDNVCDIAPLRELYVDEVIKIGEYLNLPLKIIHKAPSDGLSNMTDEEKLGFSYGDVKKVCIELETGIKSDVNDDIKYKIIKQHKNNDHKNHVPVFRR